VFVGIVKTVQSTSCVYHDWSMVGQISRPYFYSVTMC